MDRSPAIRTGKGRDGVEIIVTRQEVAESKSDKNDIGQRNHSPNEGFASHIKRLKALQMPPLSLPSHPPTSLDNESREKDLG
jgi:hypothetical protein